VRAIEVTRIQVEAGVDPQSRDSDPANINAMFGDALTAFISVLDQHTLAELAVKSPLGLTETAPRGQSEHSNKIRSRKPAARSSRRS
jgi:Rrf2 family nitric oxide-sensitive transcriptional repressor